jgi:hypothetical protein
MDREYQAFLAGVTEFWCIEFDLPMPKWVEDPLYTLPELWEPLFCPMPMDQDSIASRTRRSHPCFINRNVIFEARSLIVI